MYKNLSRQIERFESIDRFVNKSTHTCKNTKHVDAPRIHFSDAVTSPSTVLHGFLIKTSLPNNITNPIKINYGPIRFVLLLSGDGSLLDYNLL